LKRKITTFLVLFLLTVPVTYGGGFQLNEHGSKPMGLGGAFTAIANDASAVYWNGAGLSFLEGTNIILGSAIIAPRTSFRGPSPLINKTSMDAQDFFVPHFFVTHKINEKFAVGTGVSVPFGLGTRWPVDWVGRYLAVETELKVFSVPLVVSWAITDDFSISIGGSYNNATVTIKQKTSQSPFEGDAFVEMEGDDGAAFGYNFGFMWKPNDMLSIGGSFRSQVNYSFEGTATTTGAEQLSSLFPSGDISAELTTPVNIQGGIAVQVIEQLRLSADFQFVGWSSYDTLAVDIADFPPEQDIAQPRNYKDSYIIRFGAEFNVNDDISLLGGLYFDKFPVDPDNLSPSLPDSDRLGFSFGIDAKIYENLGVTGSYLFIRSAETTVTNSREYYTIGNSPFNGTYNSKANLFSLSFYYSFN
jgi:long-chain fatty acid transport protein